jgi:CubicO group peptidase (beta-lactamase class C family)
MRKLVCAALAVGCHSAPQVPPPSVPARPAPAEAVAAPAEAAATPTTAPAEVLAADTPKTTVEGTAFTAPVGWAFSVRGPATILEAPEHDARLALVDVHAKDADAAVAQAWTAFEPAMQWPVELVAPAADRDGWSDGKQYGYRVPPNEKRSVAAVAQRAGGTWTVVLIDVSQATGEKRGAQLGTVFSTLLPKGYARETFAGKTAHPLDAKRLADLTGFVEKARAALGVTGIALGIVQDGKVVLADGFGERELGKKQKPDAETLFMIASNTKALTTLLLAKLVDDKKLGWDTPVTQLMPTFKLGDADTTNSVLVRHLVCACTGLPRQDLEWLLEFKHATPESSMALLGTMQPTSKFGELFQYSNLLAAAGGYLAAHVIAPKLELGAAYDAAMTERVFKPLGMTSTTFDNARALRANHAGAFGLDLDGKPAPSLVAVNGAVVPVRPAGGAWSNVRDMLKYVQMELARGTLPDGKRYIGEEALLARRAPQVAMSKTATYGMGLMVDTRWGIPVIHHGGDLIGYHSDMIWLPDQHVGAVILTNSDDGGPVARELFRRRLLEVLFDGEALAEPELAAATQQLQAEHAALRKDLEVPANSAEVAKLAAHYHSTALGDVAVRRDKGTTIFDVGEWQSPVGSHKNADGTISFVVLSPGLLGFELVVGPNQGDKRTLITRDGQHEYTFVEVK